MAMGWDGRQCIRFYDVAVAHRACQRRRMEWIVNMVLDTIWEALSDAIYRRYGWLGCLTSVFAALLLVTLLVCGLFLLLR